MILLLLPKGYSTISRSHVCYLKWASLFRPASCQNSVVPYKFSWFKPFTTLVNSRAVEPSCHSQFIPLQDSPVNAFANLESVNIIEILKRLSKNPNAALSFFNDTKNRGCFPDVDSYTTMIQILCSSKLPVKLKFFLGEMVSSEKILGFEIVDVFHCLSRRYKDSGVLVQVLEILLKVYIDFGMYKAAISTFFQSRSYSFLPHERSFNFILNSLIDHGMSETAISFFQELEKFGLSPNIYSFTILFKSLVKENKQDEVKNVFQQMQQLHIKPDIFIYTTLMKGMCSIGKSSCAYELLQEIRGSGIQVCTVSYNVVIRGFCCEMRLSEAEDVLEDMRKQGIAADTFSYTYIIHGHCKSRDFSRALSYYDKFVSEDYGLLPDKVLYSIAIHAHCKLKNMRKANELFNKMKDQGLVPDVIHYTTVMNGYFHLDELSGGLAFFSSMLKIGIAPDIVTYKALADLYHRNGYRQEIFHLLENLNYMLDCGLSSSPEKETQVLSHTSAHGVKLLNPYSVVYGTVIEGFCQGGKVKEAEQLFRYLIRKGFMCAVTSSAMVKGYCKAGRTMEGYELFVNLCEQQILVSQIACSQLIDCLCKEGNMEKAFKVFKKMLKEDISPDVITHTVLIQGLCKVKHFKEACQLFNEMKIKGIRPDVVTYTVLLNALFKECFYYSSSRGNTKPIDSEEFRAMSFDLLTEMVEMEVELDVSCYTVLIDGHFKMDCVDDAEYLFDCMTNRGLKPDVIAYSALLAGYCRHGNVAKAQNLVNKLRAGGIMDDHTLSLLEQRFMRAKQMAIRHKVCGIS